MDFKTSLNGTRTDIELSLKDLFGFLQVLFEDNKNLKLKAFEPSKEEAKIFFDYLSWEEGNPKKNFETLYAKEIKLFNDWLKVYCELHDCNQEEALERVIEG